MPRVLVTGSTDGLGLLAARLLAGQGHAVTVHARNEHRAGDARAAVPSAEAVVVGDLASMAATREVAGQANALGRYTAVIHNAGVGYHRQQRTETADGLELHFAVNVLAPYLLTALVARPDRLVYLSSALHRGGQTDLDDPQWSTRRWNGPQAYAESKLLDVVLAFAVARRWPTVRANAVEPGWVPTRMGGPAAPDDLHLGALTQAWLAVSDDPGAQVTGAYFYHQQLRQAHPAAGDEDLQDRLLAYCEALSGVALPA